MEIIALILSIIGTLGITGNGIVFYKSNKRFEKAKADKEEIDNLLTIINAHKESHKDMEDRYAKLKEYVCLLESCDKRLKL